MTQAASFAPTGAVPSSQRADSPKSEDLARGLTSSSAAGQRREERRRTAPVGDGVLQHVSAPRSWETLRERLVFALIRDHDRELQEILSFVMQSPNRPVSRTRHAAMLADVLASFSRLAFRDELTGLHNRRGFMCLGTRALAMSSRHGRPVALFFADVDDLKHVNDAAGHQAGDGLLVRASGVLRATFRKSDLIARLSGDEFVVLTSALDAAGKRSILQRLQRALVRANSAERQFPVSLSVGVAVFDPAAPASLEELIARADERMYAQKRGRLIASAPFGTAVSE
jgi:diguanylate cyclase (GGDEF)-like protein